MDALSELEKNNLVHVESFVCDNPDHRCYGMQVRLVEGNWNGHYFHVEKFGNDRFNVQIDNRSRINQSHSQMAQMIRDIL